MFFDHQFERKRDADCDLIGFENGVFDTKTMRFRDGQPDDYLTKSTEINYVEYEQDEQKARQALTAEHELRLADRAGTAEAAGGRGCTCSRLHTPNHRLRARAETLYRPVSRFTCLHLLRPRAWCQLRPAPSPRHASRVPQPATRHHPPPVAPKGGGV